MSDITDFINRTFEHVTMKRFAVASCRSFFLRNPLLFRFVSRARRTIFVTTRIHTMSGGRNLLGHNRDAHPTNRIPVSYTVLAYRPVRDADRHSGATTYRFFCWELSYVSLKRPGRDISSILGSCANVYTAEYIALGCRDILVQSMRLEFSRATGRRFKK